MNTVLSQEVRNRVEQLKGKTIEFIPDPRCKGRVDGLLEEGVTALMITWNNRTPDDRPSRYCAYQDVEATLAVIREVTEDGSQTTQV